MAELLSLPIIHLDRHFWNPGWVEPDRKEWAQRVVELSSQDAWVMDGNYGGSIDLRLPRAEAAVLLDLPVWQCLWGIFRRSTLHRGESRPDLADGCEEQLPDWDFITFVLTYKWRSRPKVLRKIAAEKHVTLYHLRSRQAVRQFMNELRNAEQVEDGA
jgi:adenylate kinase family enzyme